MPNLKQTKTKIKSVQNLGKITKALEIVSTIKLQKNKAKAEGMKPYFLSLMQMVAILAGQISIFDPVSTTSGRSLIILMTSEKWLCGSTNSKLFRMLTSEYHDRLDTCDFFIIGKKWFEFATRNNHTIVGHITMGDEVTEPQLLPLFQFFDTAVKNYTDIHILFNFFKNTLIQIPVMMPLYPLTESDFQIFVDQLELPLAIDHHPALDNLVVEPSLAIIKLELQKQIRNYLIMAATLQNKVWEHASRMIAMKSAKDNSLTFVKKLTLTYNKLRQAIITKEISEIVSAKIALED